MRRIYVYTWRLQIIFILYTHRQTLHFLLFSFPFQFGLFDFLGRMFVFGAISRFEHFRRLRLSSSVWLYTFLLLKSLRLCVFLLRGGADFRFRTQRQSTCCWKRQLYVESATSAADYVVATLHLTGDKAMDRSLVHIAIVHPLRFLFAFYIYVQYVMNKLKALALCAGSWSPSQSTDYSTHTQRGPTSFPF